MLSISSKRLLQKLKLQQWKSIRKCDGEVKKTLRWVQSSLTCRKETSRLNSPALVLPASVFSFCTYHNYIFIKAPHE